MKELKTLFDHAREKKLQQEQPLAARMRPRTLEEYIGQEHILAPGRLLRRAIQADQLSSLIFYGPPGTGKTTLASVIANTTKSFFVTLNAVMAGIADLRDITSGAQRRLGEYQRRTILFIDEVHRWNKAQQDALLPWVENGTVILIGATTENPYFTVNRALVSRSRIFQLKSLTDEDIRKVIQQALADKERGYGDRQVNITDEAMEHLAGVANGDARAALNALELAVETTEPDADGIIQVTLAVAEESIQKRAVQYDQGGDCHYDTISAFIKSMRGSDPDATLYWLAKMVYAGEDPRFIFRRMLIFTCEDIGLADPNALRFVLSAADTFDRIGMPEGNYPLSAAALYCATAPKSNSVMGYFDALKSVEQEKEGEVPNHLRDASRDKEGFGHGVGYQYPHSYREHWVAQQYLPDSLRGKIFYEPGALGFEKELVADVRMHRELQLAAIREGDGGLAPPEILSFSPSDKATERWLARAVDNLAPQLGAIRERLLAGHRWQRHHRVLDLTAENGLCLWEATRQVPEGGVWALTPDEHSRDTLLEQAQNVPDLRRPVFLVGQPWQLPELLGDDLRFEFIIGRNCFFRQGNARARLAKLLADLLAPEGEIAMAENIPRYSQRLGSLLPPSVRSQDEYWFRRLQDAEERLYTRSDDDLLNWDEQDLLRAFQNAGFANVSVEVLAFHREQRLTMQQLRRWFESRDDSYAGRLLQAGLTPADVQRLQDALLSLVSGQTVPWETKVAFLRAR